MTVYRNVLRRNRRLADAGDAIMVALLVLLLLVTAATRPEARLGVAATVEEACTASTGIGAPSVACAPGAARPLVETGHARVSPERRLPQASNGSTAPAEGTIRYVTITY